VIQGLEERLRGHIQALSEPRNPYYHIGAHQQARTYLRESLLAQGRVVVEQTFETSDYGEGTNFIGYPQDDGQEPTHLLVAHYDTVNDSPGADDNGSAVAVALEVAARCPQIEIVLPDLEEVELLGARHFVQNDPHPHLPALVLESVGYWSDQPGSQSYPSVLPLGFPQVYSELEQREFRGDFLALLHLQADIALAENLERSLCGTSVRLPLSPEILGGPAAPALYDFGRSDHLAFWEAGRPCLMLTDSANFRNPHYHRATDTCDTLDFARMARLVDHLCAFFDS
jgi:Zn-dependent M28 family amino/carboxypeptidase